MTKQNLTITEAKKFILCRQGLLGEQRFAGKCGVLHFGDCVLYRQSPFRDFKHSDIVEIITEGCDFLWSNIQVSAKGFYRLFLRCALFAELVPRNIRKRNKVNVLNSLREKQKCVT